MGKHTIRIMLYAVLMSMLITLCACGAGGDTTDTAEEGKETDMQSVTAPETQRPEPEPEQIAPPDGGEVSLLNEEMTAWAKNYKRAKLDKICDFTEKCEPVPVSFEWHSGGADYTHLFISTSPDMSDPMIFLCLGDGLAVEDLYPGTEYYWRITCTYGSETKSSQVRSFKTLDAPRTVYIPGVSNVRDLGGKKTTDGRRVKYGLVFRGADFAHLTDDGKRKAVDILGIKTELDLRSSVKNGKSPLGDDIKYISVTAPYYTGISAADADKALVEELRAFADPDNYPIYFHCSLGRDRTGTLAFILLALLDVNETEMYMDYEVSFFSDMGGYVDTTAPSYMVSQLTALKNIIMLKNKKTAGENVAAYLLKCGLTQQEIDAIRANLLEDVK